MNWNQLNDLDQLKKINELSKEKPVLLFKHSTKCSICTMVLNRLERKWSGSTIEPYFLDLISYGEISNQVAQVYQVVHQSPQAILVVDGKAIYDASHMDIDFDVLNSIVADKKVHGS